MYKIIFANFVCEFFGFKAQPYGPVTLSFTSDRFSNFYRLFSILPSKLWDTFNLQAACHWLI